MADKLMDENGKLKPFRIWKEEVASKLLINPNVDKDKGDYHPMVVIGQHFAKQGKTVKLTP